MIKRNTTRCIGNFLRSIGGIDYFGDQVMIGDSQNNNIRRSVRLSRSCT